MRLFIAINFTDEVKSTLLQVQSNLRQCSLYGNFSRPENLHLTLVFLGEVQPGRIGAVESIMDSVRSKAFVIGFEGVGRFGDTWWIGIKPEPALIELHGQLAGGLRRAGFEVESRTFKPHLTLAREVALKPDADTGAVKRFSSISADYDTIHLMKSEYIQGRLTYTPVYEKKL